MTYRRVCTGAVSTIAALFALVLGACATLPPRDPCTPGPCSETDSPCVYDQGQCHSADAYPTDALAHQGAVVIRCDPFLLAAGLLCGAAPLGALTAVGPASASPRHV